jgi:tRNA (adenine22-N1)-methyltransferase
VVADVGTDHGYVPVWLLQNGIISRAVGTDINHGPLSRAAQVSADYGVSDRLELRLCDGLTGLLPHCADTVIIAGMGGETIAHILAAADWTRTDTALILQPQSKQAYLRRWLYANGYHITGEHLAREGDKLYTILTAAGGASPMPDTAALYAGEGAKHSDKALLNAFLEQEIDKLERLAAKLEHTSRAADVRRRAEYLEAIAGMRAMREEKHDKTQ